MAIVTKTRFSDIVFKNKDAISDRSGSKLVESISVSGANTFIAISNNINNNPKIIATGSSSLGLSVGVKGDSYLTIYSNSGAGGLAFENQVGGISGFSGNAVSTSEYIMTMPSSLPTVERVLTVNQRGEIGYSSISPSGSIEIFRENKYGYSASTTSINSYSFMEFSFSTIGSFSEYHQAFLNGILQYGLEVSSTNAFEIYSGSADYMFSESSIYFAEDDISDDDIISVFAK